MTTDNPPPLRDNSLLLPFLIGITSLLGIGLILVSAWFPGQNTQVIPTPTLTPFKYQLLATLTAVPAPEFETATPTEIIPTPTATSERDVTLFSTLTEQTGIPADDFFTPTITITVNPIFTKSMPMTAGKYDDADSQIIRNGSWKSQDNVNAYQGTLLVSNTVGNYVAFSFTGLQMLLGYQSSDNAGDLMVNIDGLEVTITQLVGNAWFSQELEPGTHYVILTHENGTAVNLDYIEILN
jgi:hypothetical protein